MICPEMNLVSETFRVGLNCQVQAKGVSVCWSWFCKASLCFDAYSMCLGNAAALVKDFCSKKGDKARTVTCWQRC